MGQRAFAAALGIKAPSVAGWEANESKPEIQRLPRIAEILGIALETLVDEETREPNYKLAELVRLASTLDEEDMDVLLSMARRIGRRH